VIVTFPPLLPEDEPLLQPAAVMAATTTPIAIAPQRRLVPGQDLPRAAGPLVICMCPS
jgi:hypothetical protein